MVVIPADHPVDQGGLCRIILGDSYVEGENLRERVLTQEGVGTGVAVTGETSAPCL